jgi:hypothetical protein
MQPWAAAPWNFAYLMLAAIENRPNARSGGHARFRERNSKDGYRTSGRAFFVQPGVRPQPSAGAAFNNPPVPITGDCGFGSSGLKEDHKEAFSI